MAVFDAAVNKGDRKGGHLLPVAGGHVFGVDHGICFAVEPKLRTVLWGWHGEPFTTDEMGVLERLASELAGGRAFPRAAPRPPGAPLAAVLGSRGAGRPGSAPYRQAFPARISSADVTVKLMPKTSSKSAAVRRVDLSAAPSDHSTWLSTNSFSPKLVMPVSAVAFPSPIGGPPNVSTGPALPSRYERSRVALGGKAGPG